MRRRRDQWPGTMRFFVVMAVLAAVGAYRPPRPSSNDGGGCGSGCGATAGASQVVTSHVSPCPGGKCGGTSGSSGTSSSGDYWWQGQDSPFDSPKSKPLPSSQPCTGGGCPSQTRPISGSVPGIPTHPSPGQSSDTIQNLLQQPMGICRPRFVCVQWQLCRNGFVIDDGTGIIDKQKKVIPLHIAAAYTSCGGDMICCLIPEHASHSGTLIQSLTPGTSFSESVTPERAPTPVLPSTQVSHPKFSGPSTGTPGKPAAPPHLDTPSTSDTASVSLAHPPTPVSSPHSSGFGTPSSPSVSGPDTGSPAIPAAHVRLDTPSTSYTAPESPAFPDSPVSPPHLSGADTQSSPHVSGPVTGIAVKPIAQVHLDTQSTSDTASVSPARPLTPVSSPHSSGFGTPSSPFVSGPDTGSSAVPAAHLHLDTPSTSYIPPGPSTLLSPPKLSGDGTQSSSLASGPGTGTSFQPAASVHLDTQSKSDITPVSPARPPTPVSPHQFSGAGTPASPSITGHKPGPVSPSQFSGAATPSHPSPHASAASPSHAYETPDAQQPAGLSPLPSTVNQVGPVPHSQSAGPVSSPVGLITLPSGQVGNMGGMMGMMGMMPQSGSCSAGTYCVLQHQCNPYTGFIMRANTAVMAVWPDSPTVPLLPCFVPDGSITDGVCCQEAHPNAGGAD